MYISAYIYKKVFSYSLKKIPKRFLMFIYLNMRLKRNFFSMLPVQKN